jgi:hypothetical protein
LSCDQIQNQINQKTDIFVSFVENKVKGAKALESLTFTVSENANASELEAVPIPQAPQLELELPEPNEHGETGADVFLRKLKDDFGLSAPQVKTVEQYIQTHGMAYIEEKIAVVNSESRPNVARAFLAALKSEEAARKRKPPNGGSAPAEEMLPEMSAGEWEKRGRKLGYI